MAMPPASQMQLSSDTQDAIEGLGVEPTASLPPDVQEELLCAICVGTVLGGTTLVCGHLFHKKCIKASLGSSRTCPTCRQENVELKPVPRVLANIMDKCIVRCPQECGEDLKWGALSAHVKEHCPKTPFRCSHEGCSAVLRRGQWAAHAESCDEAVLTCACGAQVKRSLMQSHRNAVCPDAGISCGYCGQTKVPRWAMEKHLREDCKAAATISLVKPLMDEIKALQVKQRDLEVQLRQEREAHEAKHNDLETQLCQEREKSRRLTRELGTSFRETTFKINLPARICDLPVDADGLFQMVFGGAWRLQIYPKGDEAEAAGWVSVYLGLTPDACKETVVSADLEVQMGLVKVPGSKVLGLAEDGGVHAPWGSSQFVRQEAVQHERTIYVTIITTKRGSLVDSR